MQSRVMRISTYLYTLINKHNVSYWEYMGVGTSNISERTQIISGLFSDVTSIRYNINRLVVMEVEKEVERRV